MAEFDDDGADLLLAEAMTRLAAIRDDLTTFRQACGHDPAREALLSASLAEVEIMLAAVQASLDEQTQGNA